MTLATVGDIWICCPSPALPGRARGDQLPIMVTAGGYTAWAPTGGASSQPSPSMILPAGEQALPLNAFDPANARANN